MKTGTVVFIGNPFNRRIKPILNRAEQIIDTVEKYYGVGIRENTRKRTIVFPRQIAWLILLQISNIGLTEIGKMFGKHHSTVIYGLQSVRNVIDTSPEAKRQLEEIKKMLQ